MQYPGGKNATYQKVINLIPPHQVYIETHLGSGAIMRMKRPAGINIGIDLNRAVLLETAATIAPGSIIISGDGYRYPSLNPARGSGIEAYAKNGDVSPGNIVDSGDGAASSEMTSVATIAGNGEWVHPFVDIAKNDDARWCFLCMDALAFLDSYPFTGREFIYADPPYLLSTRRSQRQLYEFELGGRQEHIDLLTRLKQLPCHVAISGYWSDLYRDLLPGWHTYSFRARTRGGSMATEWLWMNYPQPAALHDYSFLGRGFRERERINRKKQRWVNRLRRMPLLERQALLWAIQEADLPAPPVENGDAPDKLAEVSP